MPKQVYKYWKRNDFHKHLTKQAVDFGIDSSLVDIAVYSDSWNPAIDFNGCNCVQDALHPFLPCFLHDFEWIVKGGGIEADRSFRTNLVKAGFSKFKAQNYFLAVRLGWIFYFKWTK